MQMTAARKVFMTGLCCAHTYRQEIRSQMRQAINKHHPWEPVMCCGITLFMTHTHTHRKKNSLSSQRLCIYPACKLGLYRNFAAADFELMCACFFSVFRLLKKVWHEFHTLNLQTLKLSSESLTTQVKLEFKLYLHTERQFM